MRPAPVYQACDRCGRPARVPFVLCGDCRSGRKPVRLTPEEREHARRQENAARMLKSRARKAAPITEADVQLARMLGHLLRDGVVLYEPAGYGHALVALAEKLAKYVPRGGGAA